MHYVALCVTHARLCSLLLLILSSLVGPLSAQDPVATPAAASAPPREERLRVEGLPGVLVLSAAQPPQPTTIDAFLSHAGQRKSRIVHVCVAVPSAEDATSTTRARLLERWLAVGGQQWMTADVRLGVPADEAFAKLLREATGVWCDGDSVESLRAWLADERCAAALDDMRRRGGVVAGGPQFARAVTMFNAARQDLANDSAVGVWESWLPDVTLDVGPLDALTAPLAQQLSQSRTAIALQLSPDAALVVREREIRSIGPGDAQVRFAHREARFDPSHRLSTRNRVADLTALRRAAADLEREPYPPAAVAAPRVDKGTLVIVGGGGTPMGLLEKFVGWAGGKEAVIVVIPISTPEPLPPRDGAAEAFRRFGAKEVHVLSGRLPTQVEQPEVWDVLERATGVWFGGGRQWRFVDAYESTKALEKLRGVLARGGVIGGSSAGATIQGDYLVRGHPLGPHIMMAEGYERSFAFLPGVAIDQHFTQRRRQPDMLALMARYPQFLGIGLDETTAIIVRGSQAEVVGKHQAHFFDTRQPDADGRPRVVSLGDGGQFDLAERQTLRTTAPQPVQE
ncbi:MAG: cyanophycinase [Pirellulales bacterium]